MLATHPVTILVVEDEPGHTCLMERCLRRTRLTNEIVVCRDGQEALDYLFSGPDAWVRKPDDQPLLILLDLSLPVVSGYCVLERLKRDQRTTYVPVILLTTMDVPDQVAQCAALGYDLWLVKPFDPQTFVDVVTQIGFFLSVVSMPKGQAVSGAPVRSRTDP